MTDAPKKTAVRWKPADDAKLLRLRDVDLLGFAEIAAALPGRTPAACEMRYYGKLKGSRDRRPRPTGPAPVGKAVGYWRKPPAAVPAASNDNSGRASEPAPAPPAPVVERKRMPFLDHLRERAELQLRIDRQGLTAAFFGDPPSGRSALDQRAKARPAGVQRPFSIAVSDEC